jgi:hypothetical protein
MNRPAIRQRRTIVDLNEVRRGRQLLDHVLQEAERCVRCAQELHRIGVPADDPIMIKARVCLRAWKALIDGISNGNTQAGLDEMRAMLRTLNPTAGTP